jgi:hypothetical protein
MTIEKITIHKDSAITIDFSTIKEAPEGYDSIYEKTKFKSNRPAQKDFYDTLAKLKPSVIDMLEVDESDISRISIKGATFKQTKEGIMGVVLLVERAMNHSVTPIRIGTPHYIAESYTEDSDEENILTEECVLLLKQFRNEAQKYINGAEGAEDQISMDV